MPVIESLMLRKTVLENAETLLKTLNLGVLQPLKRPGFSLSFTFSSQLQSRLIHLGL